MYVSFKMVLFWYFESMILIVIPQKLNSFQVLFYFRLIYSTVHARLFLEITFLFEKVAIVSVM